MGNELGHAFIIKNKYKFIKRSLAQRNGKGTTPVYRLYVERRT